ncbi:MAG TPA: DUF3857 domain-containing protein [Candidatus Aerophobetes bacterium]|uniref:DUF3857 domain-containing protein n=1 Tax=Aerophobetes bacterium TaxID=2030807 RepID=A0A7V0MZU5_UNCAE|nr:DUF3857 domain-containing protein [Candidatus Aerophobetes bacterium]
MKVKLICKSLVLILILLAIFSSQAVALSLDEVKTYINQGRFDEAISALKEILVSNPKLNEAHLLLGRIYQQKADQALDMAIEEYQKALKDESIGPVARKELAKIWLNKGEYEKVVSLLSGLKQKDFEVLKLLGLAYFGSYQLTEAMENLERAQKINPADTDVLFSLAQVYEHKQLFDEALNCYQKIISLSKTKGMAKIARERIKEIKQKRGALTVADIKDPEIKKLILTSPGAKDYPEAGAIILLNEHEYLVKKDNTMVENIHRLIKVLNVRGRDKYGEINIDYDSTYQTVKVNFARTIKPDGSIVRVGKKDIRDIDRWAGFPLYSNAKVKVISMPEVVDGSIIEYRATVYTSKLLNEDDFEFRFGIRYFEPCLHHILRLTIPKNRKINIHYVRLKGKQPKITPSGEFLVYEWRIDNVPEIISEPNMPPWADISPFIMVSSFKSWEEFSTWWRNLSQHQPEPTEEIKKAVEKIIKGKNTQEEKAKAIYNWVATNIRYVGLEFGIAGFKPHSAEEIFNNKYGDCKDKATLLLAMYKVVGIPAYYALIGTRDMGKLEEDIPMSQFNHAIVVAKVNGKLIWLDPTAETASFGEIPGQDQEKLALVFFPDKAKFLRVPLKSPEENMMKTEMLIDIHPDASIDVNLQISTSGAVDMQMRSFKYLKPARRKQIIENWINSIAPGAKLKNYKFSDLENLNIPVKLNITFSAPDYLKKAKDMWLFTIPGIRIEAGVVGKEKREYPIVFSTTSLSVDRVKIHLPAKFKIKYIPEDVSLKLPYIYFKSTYRTAKGTIFYEGILKRNKSKITTSEYPEYKSFMEKISRKSQEQIVIQEKTNL